MKLHKNTIDAVLLSLKEIFTDNKYADKVIERVLKGNPKWGGRDRRFIAETTYDIVRWYRLLKEISDAEEYDFEKMFVAYCAMKDISPDISIGLLANNCALETMNETITRIHKYTRAPDRRLVVIPQ